MRALSPQFRKWLTEKISEEAARPMPLLDAELAKIPALQESDEEPPIGPSEDQCRWRLESGLEYQQLFWIGPRVGLK